MWRLGLVSSILVSAVAGDISGIKNLIQVNEHSYRGAQPSQEGFKALAKMGIKTVIDLRDKPSQLVAEKQTVEAAGMKYLSVTMSMHAPTDDQIKRAMRILASSSAWSVFSQYHGCKGRTFPS